MTEDNEKTLRSFFKKASMTEIPDKGFSDDTMHKIQQVNDRHMILLSRLWSIACTVAGIIIIVSSGLLQKLPESCEKGFKHIAMAMTSCTMTLTKHLLTFDISKIPHVAYFIPTAITICVAIIVMRNENKTASLI